MIFFLLSPQNKCEKKLHLLNQNASFLFQWMKPLKENKPNHSYLFIYKIVQVFIEMMESLVKKRV